MTFRDSRLWLAGLYLLHFALFHSGFHSVYLDADQLVIADQAAWMARGAFFEPFFFGQAYLLPFESYLAAPLIALGLSPVTAVKGVAALFFYLPFAWTACAHARQRPWVSVAVTLLFLALPLEYQLAAPLPRGFIVACALAWLALDALLRDDGPPRPAPIAWAALLGFCLGSYSSVALLFPALLLIGGGRRFVWAGFGVVLGYGLFKAVGLFYLFNPGYVVHAFPALRFTQGHLAAHATHPVIAAALGSLLGLGALVCAAVMAVYLPEDRSHDRPADNARWGLRLAGVALGVLAVIGLMLSTNKMADFNEGSPFFSVYRLVLPLPLLALLVMSASARRAASGGPRVPWPLALTLGALALGAVIWQSAAVVREREALALKTSTVPPLPYERLERQCARLAEALRASGERYYLLKGRNDALAYGCSAEFGLPIVQTRYERRTWLRAYLERGGG